MRLLVCGSRSFTDFDFLAKKLDKLTAKLDKKKLLVIHGGAKGADNLVERWCFLRRVTQNIYHDQNKNEPIQDAMIGAMRGKGWIIAFIDKALPEINLLLRKSKKAGLKEKVYHT